MFRENEIIAARHGLCPPIISFFHFFQFTILIWTFYYFILRWNDTLHSSLFRGLQAAGAFAFDSRLILKWNDWLKFRSKLIETSIKFLFWFQHTFLIARNVLKINWIMTKNRAHWLKISNPRSFNSSKLFDLIIANSSQLWLRFFTKTLFYKDNFNKRFYLINMIYSIIKFKPPVSLTCRSSK